MSGPLPFGRGARRRWRSSSSAWLFGTGLALSAACSNGSSSPAADTAAPAPNTPPAAAVPTAPEPPAQGATLERAQFARDAGAPSPTVKIVLRTFPARKGVVLWGSKRLGFFDRDKPLVIERPRDSGPLDVVVRVTDYLPVHTRAYTFSDSNLDVRITPVDKKDTIYGYKEPLGDAGVPFPGEPTDIPE